MRQTLAFTMETKNAASSLAPRTLAHNVSSPDQISLPPNSSQQQRLQRTLSVVVAQLQINFLDQLQQRYLKTLPSKLKHLVIRIVVVMFLLGQFCNMILNIVPGCTTVNMIFQSSNWICKQLNIFKINDSPFKPIVVRFYS